jgi:hypothetical protein
MTLDDRASSPLDSLREGIVSCAAAEGLLRGMLTSLDFSLDALFEEHLDACTATIDGLGFRDQRVRHLIAAHEALSAASHAFDPWRFSSDPEFRHMPVFRAEALRLLDIAQAEREAASRDLP